MANKGEQVSGKYSVTLDDGTLVDSTEMHDDEPLVFTVGVGQVIPGFDAAVLDMKVGETREVDIEPKDAYGEYNPNLLQTERIEDVPDGRELAKHVGEVVYLQNGGDTFRGIVVSAENGMVSVDFNHELAGKRLHFKIELLEAVESPAPDAMPEEPAAPGQSA